MKNNMLKYFLIFYIFSNVAFSSDLGSNYKYKITNFSGVKDLQSEFRALASNVFYFTRFTEVLNINYEDVLKTSRDLNLLCATDLILDNVKKDAINFPHKLPQLIVLNCEKWHNSLTDLQKKILVAHEILPLLGIEDLDYEKSSIILKVHEQYKLSNVNFIKESLRELNHQLYMSVYNCDIESFDESLKNGADLFNEQRRYSESLLVRALENGCKSIALRLMKFNLEIKKNRDELPVFMVVALDVNNSLFTFESRKEVLIEFVKYYPDAINDVINTRVNYYLGTNIDSFYVSDLCYFKSNVLHFWYSGSRRNERYSKIVKDNIDFLIKLGVSKDSKNVCGERPNDKL